jgi:phosphohistidine phosphatase
MHVPHRDVRGNGMDLYLLRHAIAVERGSLRNCIDAERPLTGKGAKKMRRIAEVLKELDISFDLILSSPTRRAKETAEIVAEAFEHSGGVTTSVHLESGGSPAALVEEITTSYRKFDNILLVGHEPYLSGLISILVSGSEGLSLKMKKGGLCKLSIETLRFGRCAIVEWIMGPAQILGTK